jgi:hypothetical protein
VCLCEEGAAAAAATVTNVTDQFLSQFALPLQSSPAPAATMRQVAPIVLTAEQLSNLLASHVMSAAVNAATDNTVSQPMVSSELIQYLVDQSQTSGPITLSLESLNIPDGSHLAVNAPYAEQVSNDLNVGAQEMVLEDNDSSLQKHPLHSS